MASSIRRDTYVLGGNGPLIPTMKREPESSRIERQNLMRMKINRIALIQEVKVQHVLPFLIEHGVITSENHQKIISGSTTQDKTRILIDILASKTKETEWYKHFIAALLNSSVGLDVKKRYQILVEFLNNTFIPQPAGTPVKISEIDSNLNTLTFPKYDMLPGINENNKKAFQQKNKNENNLVFVNENDLEDENALEEGKFDLEDNNDHEEIHFETFDEVNNLEVDKGKSPDILVINDDVSEVDKNFDEVEKGFSDNKPEKETMRTADGGLISKRDADPPFSHSPESFESKLEIPEKHLSALEESNSAKDKKQIEQENLVLSKLQKFELILELKNTDKLPKGFEISMCTFLTEILSEPEYYYYYVKYYEFFKVSADDIIASFSSVLKTTNTSATIKNTDHIIAQTFDMCDLFVELSLLTKAEQLLNLLVLCLDENPNNDTPKAKYRVYVKLIQVQNRDYRFSQAEQIFFKLTQLIGQDNMANGELLIELSYYQMERGSIATGFGWANKALQEVPSDNPTMIINAMCNGVLAYCHQLQVKKACDLVVQTVLLAKSCFGSRHPMYLKSMLYLCYFTSEFVREEITLHIAEFTFKLAGKIYGCESLQVALAHKAVARALMLLQVYDDDDYYEHAMEAVRIARKIFQYQHPILISFLHTWASALQWKALNSQEDIQDSTLYLAETEAKLAVQLASSCYGEFSLKAAQSYSLLGQIYSKMNSHPVIATDLSEEAEINLKKCVANMKLCQPPTSHHYLLSLTSLGLFYKLADRPHEAVRLLQEVVFNIETYGFYLWWVHVCYEDLLSCLMELGDTEIMTTIQERLNQWLENNPLEQGLITLEDLHQTPVPFSQFLQTFTIDL